MRLDFKPVKEYREIFSVVASFYKTDSGNEARLFADVVRKGFVESPIDAYLIMINPGSCKIKDNAEISGLEGSAFYKNFDVVEAVSDPAQKCIMALMDLCQLNKIRILNLFDLREGDFSKALKLLNEDKSTSSIFAPERELDRKKVMPNQAVVIASWGSDSRLNDLKKTAIECIGENNIIGIKSNNATSEYDYKYIKPMNYAQQIEVIELLAECYMAYKKA